MRSASVVVLMAMMVSLLLAQGTSGMRSLFSSAKAAWPEQAHEPLISDGQNNAAASPIADTIQRGKPTAVTEGQVGQYRAPPAPGLHEAGASLRAASDPNSGAIENNEQLPMAIPVSERKGAAKTGRTWGRTREQVKKELTRGMNAHDSAAYLTLLEKVIGDTSTSDPIQRKAQHMDLRTIQQRAMDQQLSTHATKIADLQEIKNAMAKYRARYLDQGAQGLRGPSEPRSRNSGGASYRGAGEGIDPNAFGAVADAVGTVAADPKCLDHCCNFFCLPCRLLACIL